MPKTKIACDYIIFATLSLGYSVHRFPALHADGDDTFLQLMHRYV
jgi:hypothetical protein